MPEWKRPQWDKPDDYPDPDDKKVTNNQWAWEFLRRSKDYAKDWRDPPIWIDGIPISDDDDFTNYADLCKKYMVRELYHPSTEWKNVAFRIEDFMPAWAVTSFESPKPDVELKGKHEVLIKFKLNRSLEEQIKWATNILRIEAKEKRKKYNVTPYRIQKDNYRQYLQLLDGRNAKVPFPQLGKVICNTYSDSESEAKRQHKQAVEFTKSKYKMLIQI